MRAMFVAASGGSMELVAGEAPEPWAGPGELLIRVHAAGVTPTELDWYPTSFTKDGKPRVRAIPGHEFSGVVAAAAEGAGFQAGQEVYGMNDWFAEGATAEYCLALPSQVAPKPARLSHAEAATVPIGALTAWQGLFDHARLMAGERVLVHGGAGSVGIFAIQLARQRGARVVATASAHNLDFLRELGAEQAIDYRATRFEEAAGEIDVVFDTVGGGTLARSWNLLKAGGRMVTVASGERDERAQQAFFIVEPQAQQLTEVAALLDAGKLRTTVDSVAPFAQAPAAYAGALRKQGRGKVAVAVAG